MDDRRISINNGYAPLPLRNSSRGRALFNKLYDVIDELNGDADFADVREQLRGAAILLLDISQGDS